MRMPGLAIAIMGKKKPGMDYEKSSSKYMKKQEENDYEMAFKDAAREAYEYMDKGDVDGFADALKAAIEICFHEYQMMGDEDY